MDYYNELALGLRWTSRISFVFLLIVSFSGAPYFNGICTTTVSCGNSHAIQPQSHVLDGKMNTAETIPNYQEEPTTCLGLQSTVERFVNASWNTKSAESIQLEQNNETIDWPDPKPQAIQRITNSTKDLNSSLQVDNEGTMETYSPLESEGSSGTTLFEDECTSTSGWISQTDWSGEQLLTQLQTGIALTVNSGRYKSGNIPALDGVYMHGPMWTKIPAHLGEVGEGLSLEVNLQHEYLPNIMGDVGVAVYDMFNEIIFRAWIHDAWYGSRSDACVGYYYLDSQGGGASQESVQLSGSWSGTIKIWYDKDSDSINASIASASFTLVTDPTEEELSRSCKTVAIYFGRLQTRYYDSKFIDSIHLSVDTSPITEFPACPLTPAMDGHWFPQEGYSRLYFEVNQPYIDDIAYYLRIKIESDQEAFDRTLTVKVDGFEIYSNYIRVGVGFDGYLMVVYGIGVQKVELQINWGAYAEKGWKLTYFYPMRLNGEPLEVVGEYFPQDNPAHLTYLARLGPDAKISLKQEADQDPIPRTTRVYVDGQLKYSGTGDHAWEWPLGDYTYNSLHEIVIELQFGGYSEWGKELTINRVHFLTGSVEIDYMAGHEPSQDDLDVLEAYFITMNYNRVELHIDDKVPYVYEFDLSTDGFSPSQQLLDYESTYCDHSGDSKWVWVLCLHYISMSGTRVTWYGGHWLGHGIFMHDQVMKDYAAWPWTPPISPIRRTVMFHEYGHHINIVDVWPDYSEKYCANYLCAMANSALNYLNYPWYCEHHWTERRWPGW